MASLKELRETLEQHYLLVPIERLRKAPWNFKEDDAAKAAKLVENVRCNGQIKNCNVRRLGDGEYGVDRRVATGDGTYEIIDGNHRLDAYKTLGMTHAICYDHGSITKGQGIVLAHSVVEFFEIDRVTQAQTLATLFEEEPEVDFSAIAEVAPFTLLELTSVSEILSNDWRDTKSKESEQKMEKYTIRLEFLSRSARDAVNNALRQWAEAQGVRMDGYGAGLAVAAVLGVSEDSS